MSNTHGPRSDEWVKSTYSDGHGGQCIEWAPALAAATGEVRVRDSKDTDRMPLSFDGPAWGRFVRAAAHAKLPN
ncbi:DUF397 domain-containing protein [Streptomyces sp. MS19]|uniref:DUF397 domain-containing protein n=1 Tax=Streptomyces sp. MS19 TaxID=3385972 RepID=UPI0039A15C6A